VKKVGEVSLSMDPAVINNDIEKYLAVVNKLKDVTVHLDIMRESMVGVNKCTREEYKYILENSVHPVDVHIMADYTESCGIMRDIHTISSPRSICIHVSQEFIAESKDGKTKIVMAAKPGFSGQPFMEEAFTWLKNLREKEPSTIIIIDCGVNEENLAKVIQSGADVAVIGSAAYKVYKDDGEKAFARQVSKFLDIVHR